MKTNNKMVKILSSALIITMMSSPIAFAKGHVVKDETVYVNLDNNGEIVEKISSIRLHSESGLKGIKDKSKLKDIRNVKTDDEPEIKGSEILWDTDDKDIYYQGEVVEGLPIKVDIRYFLDGVEVDPEEIAGEDGDLEIKVDLVNKDKRDIDLKDGEKREGYAPYMVATVIDLPEETFSDVEISTGKLIDDGSKKIVTFVSLPGMKETLDIDTDKLELEDSLTINTKVSNFKMKPIMITATSEIPEIDALDGAKDLSELTEGIEKIKEASDKLAEATEKLSEGQGELGKGIDELVSGVDKLKLGSNKLKDGSSELKNGMSQSVEGSKKIDQGAKVLAKSGGELGEGFKALGDGTEKFGQSAVEFSKGADQVAKGIESIPENANKLSQGMDGVITGTEKVKSGQDNLTQGLDKSKEAIDKIKKGKEREKSVIGLLLKSVDGLDKIAIGIENLPGGEGLAGQVKAILNEQRQALLGINNSSDELIRGLEQVEEGLEEARLASSQLSEGLGGVEEGQNQINGGLKELAKGTESLKGASQELVKGSQGLNEGAKTIKDNAGKAGEGARQFGEGTKGLSRATGALSEGLGKLDNGMSELNNGIGELTSGTDELSNGSVKLKDGSNQLRDGSEELNEKMNEFNEDGIHKMSDELDGADLDIENIIDVKDSLVDIAKTNNSLSGIGEGMDGSLKFIMRTDGVEEKIEEVEEVEEIKESKSDSIKNWIKNLFNS